MKTLAPKARRLLRSWPVAALGAGMGLIIGSIIDATAQDIVDPEVAAPVRAESAPSPLISLPVGARTAPRSGAAPSPRPALPPAIAVGEGGPLLDALTARSDALNQQIATINASETALAVQLREIEVRLQELRELQRSMQAGCAATHATENAELRAALAAAEARAAAAPPAPAPDAEADADADAEAESAQETEPEPAPEPAAAVAPPAPDPAELEAARRRNERLAVLTDTVRAMRDDNAATLIETLDLELAAAILRRMSPRDTGRILDRIDPEHAAELSEALLEPEEE
jgi:flagellar motility protein MotE (MotC chaperone)